MLYLSGLGSDIVISSIGMMKTTSAGDKIKLSHYQTQDVTESKQDS